MTRSRRPQLPLRLALTGVAATSLAGLGTLAAASTATAAPAPGNTPATAPTPGTNLLTDGALDQPDASSTPTGTVEGDSPTGWTLVNLDNETAPYEATISEYNATGSYPPPTPVPNTSGYAPEVFYEGGYDLGSEGIGGQQTSATFGTVTQADNPQVGFSTSPTNLPDTSAVTWAGSVDQIVVTSGGQTYTLRYFDPFAPPPGETYGAPSNTATTKYIVGPSLGEDTWTTNTPRSLNADLSAQFGLSTYTVSSVTFGVLEDTTNPNGPDYPNETAYFTNISLTEGPSSTTPPPALPESPAIVELPLAAVALLAGGLVLRRRRRTSPSDEG